MEYECQNQGCETFEFEGADEEWYWDHGMDTPRNCPDCREWKKEQEDEVFTCSVCGNKRFVSRGVKIMYHKNEGVWEDPEWCLPCERDPDRRKRFSEGDGDKDEYGRRQRQPGQEKKRKEERLQPKITDSVEEALDYMYGNMYTNVTPIRIPDTADGFREFRDPVDGDRLRHLDRRHSSDFARKGYSIDTAILHLAGLAASDDPAIVAEFQDKSYVVKYDKENEVVGIVEPDAEMPITGFPKPPSAVAGKIRARDWLPR